MDTDAKLRVRDALRARVEAQLGSSHQAAVDQRSAAELDPDTSYTVDDVSQADEDGELAGLLEGAEDRQAGLLATLDGLDFGPKDTVVPGAIVAFGGDHYVVGTVAEEFACDGVTYEGISADSRLYAVIEGLRAGDIFTFDGQEHRVDLVA